MNSTDRILRAYEDLPGKITRFTREGAPDGRAGWWVKAPGKDWQYLGATAEAVHANGEAAALYSRALQLWDRVAGAEALVDLLSGPSGVALCTTDPAPVAKALADFARTSKLLELRGGVLDGRAISANDAQRLATLPPRQVLLTQLVSGLASPIQGFANVLSQLPRSLVVALDQVRQQKEAAAA